LTESYTFTSVKSPETDAKLWLVEIMSSLCFMIPEVSYPNVKTDDLTVTNACGYMIPS